ncbi:MAG: tyrosine-type recombinase/integrase [Candidatus Latescibacteria bacterium]|nr:tyrosine-type recombinase/integrase [Candidatus Latescibacterota bacterium]
MATISPFKPRGTFRINYTLVLLEKKVRKAKYAPTLPEARTLKKRLEALEQATRTGVARLEDIEEWTDRKWLKLTEAELVFPGFAESYARKQRVEGQTTDFDQIEVAFESYSLQATSQSGGAQRNHQNSMSHARVSLEWLKTHFPNLLELQTKDIQNYRYELEREFAPWTVFHRMTKMRLLLDRAVELQMIPENPARAINLPQPKRQRARRVLGLDEIQWLLKTSLQYRQWIHGGVPTIVRMGLYAGLRDIEMTWFAWEWVDWHHRIVNIGETTCKVNGQRWVPKSHEVRSLDVKLEFVDYLKEERDRQQGLDLYNQFVLPAGNKHQFDYRGRPLSQDAPQKAFYKMMGYESREKTGLTLYALRHTYCTSLLRPPPYGAGLDIRTVQRRMGHADIRTTELYLREIGVEKHPTDALPY